MVGNWWSREPSFACDTYKALFTFSFCFLTITLSNLHLYRITTTKMPLTSIRRRHVHSASLSSSPASPFHDCPSNNGEDSKHADSRARGHRRSLSHKLSMVFRENMPFASRTKSKSSFAEDSDDEEIAGNEGFGQRESQTVSLGRQHQAELCVSFMMYNEHFH